MFIFNAMEIYYLFEQNRIEICEITLQTENVPSFKFWSCNANQVFLDYNRESHKYCPDKGIVKSMQKSIRAALSMKLNFDPSLNAKFP